MCVCVCVSGVRLTLSHSEDDKDESGPLFLGLHQALSWPEPLAVQAGLPDEPGELIQNTLSAQYDGNFDSFWWDYWGVPKIDDQLSFTTLEGLRARLTSPAFKVECECWFKEDKAKRGHAPAAQ